MVFIKAFLLTICLEVPIAMVCGLRRREELAVISAVNVLTNPIAVAANFWLYYSGFSLFAGLYGMIPRHICIEFTVILVEGLLYRRYVMGIAHPWRVSFATNMVSIIGGQLLMKFL